MWSYLTSIFSSTSEQPSKSVKMASGNIEQPALANHDSSVLDLAFVMDCTGSMGSYIENARSNIRKIVEDIVAKEKSDVCMALVEYRDHPPQDSSFVTRPHDFTPKVGKMKSWLEECTASGGGDGPEAVADGLHDLLKLNWRAAATKIAILISDAPPHGLGDGGDGFPNGCPSGLDPMEITSQLAEKGVTLYVVGCEPSICPHKDFFTGLAYLTGGQYVPLAAAKSLTTVIIGGAQEELSLEQWMDEVNREVQAEVQAKGADNFDEEVLSKRLADGWASRGAQAKQLQRNSAGMGEVSSQVKEISKMKNLSAYRAAAPAAPQRAQARASSVPMFAPMAPSMSSMDDVYECNSGAIQMEQASRMVQKAKMRNQALFK
ncbi:uncharacterized protein LOC124135371 [Haliotis rufescens]|uniref:uncharacterized protein LOC124135371 n=1 Tax=Haliotis rufescens TaxID=6454 RepID=UPI00201E7C73|nr:uncharacterized protein LOC124135371 [Haliotis rufescens]XP_046356634.2 uncharacterized protein LOC124135371 [Haliotis rufescens]